MKRWICTLLSILLVFSSILSEEKVLAGTLFAEEMVNTARTSFNDTFPTVDGGTVSLKADISKEVTVIVFGKTTCSNTEALLKSISQSGWIHDPKVKVIFAEISKANEALTRHYISRYGCEEMTACYSVTGGISEIMGEYLGEGGSNDLPVVVLFDKKGNVQEVLTACYSANDLYLAIKKFAEISGNGSDGKIDQERTLSVNGQENYDEAEKVFRLINQTRAAQGVGKVELDAELTETAMLRAAELSLYYGHVRPCGEDCLTLFRVAGKHSENCAVGSKTAQAAMDGWIESAGHYKNIINADYTSVGVGCFTDNNGMNYWVQCFDNEKANEVKKSGVYQIERSISILESHIHLEAITNVFSLSCAEDAKNAKIVIRNNNEMWEYSTPTIQPSNLTYNSSDTQIAETDENGMVTVKAAGDAVIMVSLKEAPDIGVKINVTKKEHSYVLAPGQTESGDAKYVCKTCGDIQGSETDNIKAEINSNISISKDKSVIQIIDARTNKPISLARIWVNGEYWTDKNGIVTLSRTGLTTIEVEKEGYHKKTVQKELNNWQTSVVKLCPNNGALQVVSATLSAAGKEMDVLDNIVSLIDKNLDGETNLIDTDFKLNVEAAGKPIKYQLIQNGKVLKQSTDGKFILQGHYANGKNGKVSYYLDDLSAGYETYVWVYDEQGKIQKQKLGIRVSKGSSFAFKKLETAEQKGKIDFDLMNEITVTMPDSIPILGGTDLKFGLERKAPLQISIDHNTGLVRIAYNMGNFDTGDSAAWNNKKQEYKNLSRKAVSGAEMSELFGGTALPFSAGYFSITGGIMGYGEGYWDEISDSVRINLSLVVKVKGEEKFEKYGFISGVPVYVSFKTGAEMETSGTGNFLFNENGIEKTGGTLEFKFKPYLNPEAGIGVNGVLSYGAYGKIDLTWIYRYLNNYSLATINGEAGLKSTVLFAEKKYPIINGTFVLSDSNSKSVSHTARVAKTNTDSIDMSGANIISMDYLSKRTEKKNAMNVSTRTVKSSKETDSVRILDHAYGNASPRLVQAGDKLYLFYLDGVQGRSEQNQTSLFYRISSDNGMSWSEAFRADGGANETADYNFDVVTDGDTIYALWSDSGKVYGDELLSMDINSSLAKVGKEMNLMLSVIDAATGKVKETSAIKTDDADLQPKIAVGNEGEVFAAWVRNDVSAEDGLISNKNKMSICYVSSEDDYEVHNCPLAEGFYPMTLDVGILGSQLCIAAGLDTDADLDTHEDREVYCLKTGEELSRQTFNSLADSVPVFGSLAGENCLFWHQDGNVAYTADGENIRFVFGSENPSSVGQGFSLLEGKDQNAAIVWTAASLTEEKGTDVYCTDFNGSEWSAVYRLGTLDSEYRNCVDGCLNGSEHQIVYLGSSQKENELVSHISLYTPGERTDTLVAWEAEEDGTPGAAYPLKITVTNTGNKVVESLSVVSEDGSINDIITGLSIAPGTSEELVWDGVTLPKEMTETFYLKLTIAAEGEKDTEENQIELSVGAPDLSIEAYQDFSSGEQFASVMVTNNGIVPSSAVLTVYKDEEHTKQLYQTEIPQLQGGESRITLLDLTVLDSETRMFYFAVSDASNMESYTEDNQTVLYIGRGMYLDHENGSDVGEDVKPPTNYAYKLNDDKTTITITKCNLSAANINIPSSIDGYKVTEIGDKAFQNMKSVEAVTVPSTVKTIGKYAFSGCTSLKTLNLPTSLSTIYENAFLNSGISTIKYAGTSKNWINIKIYTTGNTKFLNATVTGSDGKKFSADKAKWIVKKPSVPAVKSFKAKAGKKKLMLSWKKVADAAGYQIQISTKKNFKGVKTISISKSKKSYTKKKLKAKKKYYIRMRAYKTYKDTSGKTQKAYGKWKTISRKTK